jgi:hypothetical protein
MTPGHHRIPIVTRTLPYGVLALLLFGSARLLAAQTAPEAKDRLVVEEVQIGWCVDFLIDPALAGHLLPKGWTGTPAGEVEGLPQGLTRTFEENVDWKGWFPGRVCGVSTRSATIRGRAVESDNVRKPPTVVWLQIAAHGGAPGVAYVLPMVATNTFRIRSPLSASGIKLDDFNFETGPNPVKDDPQDGIQVKLNGATLFWKGYLKPDTLPAAAPDTLNGFYQNDLDKSWRIQVTRAGGTPNRVAGVVGVLGKGDLFHALNSSPIRLFSMVQTGGTVGVAFFEKE